MPHSRKKTWTVTGGTKRRERDRIRDFWEGIYPKKIAISGFSRTRSRFGRKAVKSTTLFGPQLIATRTKSGGFKSKTVHRLTQRWF